MTGTILGQGLTLAIHPHSRGFGWVAFEGPFSPHDWGFALADRDKNATCMRKLDEMFERFLPDTIVLEALERRVSAGGDRIGNLCRAIVSAALARSVEVAVYSKGQVRACFASVGAKTRHEIAEAVVRMLDVFRNQFPNKRHKWESQDRRMAIFNAAALGLTHYQLGVSRLFNDLS